MNLKNKKIVNFIFYIVYVMIYLYVVKKYGMGSEDATIRYYALLFIIVIGFITIVLIRYNSKFNEIKEKKLLFSLFVAAMFLLFSYFKSHSIAVIFNGRTIVQIFLFLLPTLYAFVTINIFSREEVVKLFKITTVMLIITYFTEGNHTIKQFFNISNWLSIDFANSKSFTESHLCARCFTILFLFFNYVYWNDRNKSNKKYLILNFAFTVLCFKRIDIIVAIFTFLFGKYFSFDKKTSLKNILITTILITVVSYLYFLFLARALYLLKNHQLILFHQIS